MPHPEDDDKTVIRPITGRQTPVTDSSAAGDQRDYQALPVGTRIAEFEITALIGIGGFGIVYLAHDHSLGRKVALKEYMPSSLASRMDGVTVSAKSDRYAETFAAGLGSFMNEARMLALFDHPSLIKVYRFWEANGTAYMVMPYYEGLTLKQALTEMAAPPSEDWLKALLIPLLDALQVLHRENCFHRDIAPDNILLLKSGRPVLLDFGAARLVIGDLAKNLTVILKPGFAPVEQYADIPNLHQGAWTDIYALAAVVHYAITGKPPTPSIARLINDTAIPLERVATGHYSADFLRAIDRALAVKPEHRPQNVGELRNLLTAGDSLREPSGSPELGSVAPSASAPARLGKKTWLLGLAVAVLIMAGGVFFMLDRNSGPTSPTLSSLPAAGAPEAVVEAPRTASQPALESKLPPAPQPVDGQSPAGVQSSTPAAQVVTPTFNPMDALDQLFELRERDHVVTVNLEQSRVRIDKDKLRFRVKSERSGYLYVMMIGTEKEHINLLFPNGRDSNNKLTGGKEMRLPGAGWSMTAAGPPGTNQFVAVVSEHPRDFTDAGLSKVGLFAEFHLDTVARLLRSNAGTAAALAGKPACDPPGTCSSVYGAARFSIEEIN